MTPDDPAEKDSDDANENEYSPEAPEGPPLVEDVQAAKQSGKFDRTISEGFIKLLELESKKGGWWADVLADETLFIAVRGEYLDVYSNGQRLFGVKKTNGSLKVETHKKYLINPDLDGAVHLDIDNNEFGIENLRRYGFISRYEGTSSLNKMKRASAYYAGSERKDCHIIAVRNQTVIDCEIAFPGSYKADDGRDKPHGKVDLASLEADGDNVRLVFWEAKQYRNLELRALSGDPPVVRQILRYQNYISSNRDDILCCYRKVAKNLVAISEMGARRGLSPLVAKVNETPSCLILDTPDSPAQVGLLIFSYDQCQAEWPSWRDGHLRLLRDRIGHINGRLLNGRPRVVTNGKAKDIKL